MSFTEQMTGPAIAREEAGFRWRTAVQERLTTMELRPTGRFGCCGSVQEHDIGDLLITDWECPDVEGLRGSAMVARDAEALLLLTASTGRQIIETRHETVVLRPGSVLVMSTRATGRFVIPETLKTRTVRVPAPALSPYGAGPRLPEYLLLDTAQHPLAKLTEDYLAGVVQQLRHMSPVEIEGARNGLLVLISGMLRAAQRADLGLELLPLLRRQLESWIVDHLRSGPIRVYDLAAAHNVAPRTVHRAFAATGDTVGSVVRAHRVAAARGDLVNTADSVSAIAHRWGFCDASHLGREFRRVFALSPRDYREAHGTA